jgi:O-antigen/teichoic acid export membrane protein
MKFLSSTWQTLKQDALLKRVIRNSGYLFSSNGVSIALSTLQSILAARLLGVDNLGILGTITVFASTVNRLFSFRMGEVVVKYLGEYLPAKQDDKAAALIKAAALTEGATSILAFLVLWLLSPLAAKYLSDNALLAPLFVVYGISILGNLMAETATGILQVTNRFGQQAIINLLQSVLTAVIILAAFLFKGNLLIVLLAYLVGKLILGIGPMVLALSAVGKTLGKGWWRASFSVLPPLRELGRFAISTNLSATVNLLVRDSELLWVAFFLSNRDVGYYKIALAIITLIPIPVQPFISTTFPEISRITAIFNWSSLRTLLKRVTLISAVYTAAAAIVLTFFGRWLILFYGAEYLPAYPALLVLLIGYGLSNIMFWNRTLLLSFNQPTYPFYVTLLAGIAKMGLAFYIIPNFGFVGAAALLTGYFIISGGLMVQRGLREMNRAEQLHPLENAA